jgi:hypothetical protein
MNIAKTIQNRVDEFPVGKIFGYQDMPNYEGAPNTVIKALGRMVLSQKIRRLSKGKFYIPKPGILGARKPSDDELIRSSLYQAGQLRGYITGLCLYNKLGLTTQVPMVITIATNGSRQIKGFGTISIKTISTIIPIQEEDVQLLQYLDVLKDIKKIPDANPNDSLLILSRYITDLSKTKQKRLSVLALQYYKPQVRVLLGIIFEKMNFPDVSRLKKSLNPITKYNVNLDGVLWPNLSDWNINNELT